MMHGQGKFWGLWALSFRQIAIPLPHPADCFPFSGRGDQDIR